MQPIVSLVELTEITLCITISNHVLLSLRDVLLHSFIVTMAIAKLEMHALILFVELDNNAIMEFVFQNLDTAFLILIVLLEKFVLIMPVLFQLTLVMVLTVLQENAITEFVSISVLMFTAQLDSNVYQVIVNPLFSHLQLLIVS